MPREQPARVLDSRGPFQCGAGKIAKLREHGIAPPQSAANGQTQPLRFVPPAPACPRCGARTTVRLSEFGSTACKALYRCEQCREPFEYFKPI